MTNEELIELIRTSEARTKQENMSLLWQQNRNFIYKLAMKYQGYAEIDDLLQEGYIGLCNAVEHYDPEKGVQFLSYASFWIEQIMRRYIENCTGVIRLPARVKYEVQQYKKIVSEYQKWYGREPSDMEMAGFLGVNAEKLESIKKNVFTANMRSLNEVIGGENEDISLEDTIASEQDLEEDVIKRLDTIAMKEELWAAVDKLPDNSAEVIKCRFKDNMTLQEIGDNMGVTKGRVAQIENKAVRMLKRMRDNKNCKLYYEQYIGRHIRHVGVSEFNRTWTSSVELAVLEKEHQERMENMRRGIY